MRAPATSWSLSREENAMASHIHIFSPDTLAPPLGQYHHVTRIKTSEFLFIVPILNPIRVAEEYAS